MLKAITCFETRKKVKVLGGGSSLDMLIFVTAICRAVAEKIAKEKNMEYQDAMKFVISSIDESSDKLDI